MQQQKLSRAENKSIFLKKKRKINHRQTPTVEPLPWLSPLPVLFLLNCYGLTLAYKSDFRRPNLNEIAPIVISVCKSSSCCSFQSIHHSQKGSRFSVVVWFVLLFMTYLSYQAGSFRKARTSSALIPALSSST